MILGAILTYLEASRNTRFKKHVYYGVIAAIGATGLTWFVASYVIEISGANRELIEAIAALSATAMLFYVSFWVLNKIEHKKWMEFVKAKGVAGNHHRQRDGLCHAGILHRVPGGI